MAKRAASTSHMPYDWDVAVIGGGSGGISAARHAAKGGARVIMFDYVHPSPAGTKWGLGGTCVNVGCIPKLLMHTAAEAGHSLLDARAYGWSDGKDDATPPKHNWTTLVQAVNDHVQSLNWGYRVDMRKNGVSYENAWARFVDEHTLEYTDAKGNASSCTAENIVIAVGGRPRFPDTCVGAAEHGISSDDIFWRAEKPPGKTLVVGGSYVALECAGFLSGLGYDTTVMVRSILLRGFDQECAELIGRYMAATGTKFLRPCVPKRIEATEDGRKRVTWHASSSNGGDDDKVEHSDVFDTVLFAVGRDPELGRLLLDRAGVAVDADSGKIVVDPATERTNVPHVYAIGDVVRGRPELTPVAIQQGKLLGERLSGRPDGPSINYEAVATTVFTPIEYGCCGVAEEDALAAVGGDADSLEVYHSYFSPLQWQVPYQMASMGEGPPRPDRDANACFCKVLVDRRNDRVVGLHFVGPHAGEVLQGFSAAMVCGLTWSQLEQTIGIHPTAAEEFVTLKVTKRSGEDAKKTGC